jgi:aminoglycoside 6'-N-acetyltransferase
VGFYHFFEEIPIGYIQYYNVHDFPREQGDDISELPISCAGLDWYIGEVEFTGKGIGTKALRDFLHQYVFPSFKNVFVDPDTANVGAIRVYAKTGFAVVKKVNHGKITWMLCERD